MQHFTDIIFIYVLIKLISDFQLHVLLILLTTNCDEQINLTIST